MTVTRKHAVCGAATMGSECTLGNLAMEARSGGTWRECSAALHCMIYEQTKLGLSRSFPLCSISIRFDRTELQSLMGLGPAGSMHVQCMVLPCDRQLFAATKLTTVAFSGLVGLNVNKPPHR